ncbi:amino acid adenylation domain-containing protein [Bradyrhizobium sp. SZCCHNR1015]|uniref:amino acid adenylation domain-containing protein n=1 Tax=Bradyrhizobium sp. SZCCHNR1015 TaxID=3057338 RepID=UPI0029164BE5|nr:amino acid adenylation domain-containing protein [Bradyrhizobium sp. SZCCHNR1015]
MTQASQRELWIPIHEVIAARAHSCGNTPAVITENAALTYGELQSAAEVLCGQLRKAGVEPGQRIGVWAERTTETIVGILGILRAGAAFVPLAPRDPASRTKKIAEAADIAIIVGSATGDVLYPFPDTTWLAVTPKAHGGNSADPEERCGVRSGDLAYVIFTSGSTGQPKGVMVSHENLTFSTRARLATYPEPMGGFLLLSSLTFDSALVGIFWALSTGGYIVIPSDQTIVDSPSVLRLIKRHAITHWLSIPALYENTLDHADPNSLESLKVVIVAGETCPASLCAKHRMKAAGVTLYNEYGPTEATIWATVHDCTHCGSDEAIPIGRAIPGADVILLDQNGDPVRDGAAGEIHIAGPGVALGYLRDPALTALRFVPDRFFGSAGARLYKTGDLGRRGSGGDIEFLGRTDNQLKVRGFRVQLEEIEAIALTCSGVRACAAVAKYAAGGELKIVLYLEADPGIGVDSNRVVESLAVELPKHMRPAEVNVLDHLPRGQTGKVDRTALASIVSEGDHSSGGHEPLGNAERIIAAIWKDLLRVEYIYRDDDFFQLGGHSLLATQAVARIRAAMGVELPVHLLFEATTLRALASMAEQALQTVKRGKGCRHVPMRQGAGTRLLALVVAEAELDACRAVLRHASDESIHAFVPDSFDPEASLAEVEDCAQRILEALRTVRPSGSFMVAGWKDHILIAAELAARLESEGDEVSHLLHIRPAGFEHSSLDPDLQARLSIIDFSLDPSERLDSASIVIGESDGSLEPAPQKQTRPIDLSAPKSQPHVWSCPRCQGLLSEISAQSQVQCTACSAAFPKLGTIPVLVQNPDVLLTASRDAASRYGRLVAQSETYFTQVLKDTRQSYRWPFARRVLPALRSMRELPESFTGAVDELLARTNNGLVRQETDLGPPDTADQSGTYGFHNLSYLRTDWAGTPEGETQVAAMRDRLIDQLLARHLAEQTVLVLGVGTGRILYELASVCARAIGIDLCVPYAYLFDRLQSGPIPFHEVQTFMPLSVDSAIRSFRAVKPVGFDRRTAVEYAVADARRIPLRTKSVSVVVSAYFTDAVPMVDWLPEVVRTLNNGGYLIHLGPLGYAFQQPRGLLMPEEITDLLAAYGFRIEESTWFPLSFMASPSSGFQETHQVWSLVARLQVG